MINNPFVGTDVSARRTNEKVDSQDGLEQTQLAIGRVLGLVMKQFDADAVSVSHYLRAYDLSNYMERVARWAAEFQSRKHILTPREVEVLTSGEYTDFLGNEEELP